MKSKVSLILILSFLLIIVFSSASNVAGQQIGPDTIARRGSNTRVQWRPQVAYESATLTVTGPNGYIYQRTFPAGVTPYFQSYNADGSILAEGSYTYEIQLTPALSAETKAELANTSDREAYINELSAAGTIPDSSLLTIWGYLTISDGKFVTENVEELDSTISSSSDTVSTNDVASPSAVDDIVHLDDVIIVGSACVGGDCVNGESFGFDTLRLKENNLRIRAFDTSNSSSFPSNDWQITFNDSSNGGANKFSIDDIDGGRTPFTIEAGTPSNTLYVDSGKRIGIGTSTPSVLLHTKNGNTPTLRLEQDGSSGFTAQTWDVAGNEANFFIRDVTNGSKLPFQIKPGADTASLFIAANNNVGIGTSSPSAPLHVRRTDGSAQILVEDTSSTVSDKRLLSLTTNGGPTIRFTDNDSGVAWNSGMYTFSGSNFAITRIGTGGVEFLIDESGQVTMGPGANTVFTLTPTGDLNISGTLSDASSRDIKENFEKTDSSILDRVMELPIYYYNYKIDDDSILHVGPTAEDFSEVFNVGADNKHISPRDLAGVAVAAVQELYESVELKGFEMRAMQTELDAQQDRIAELEAQNADLEARLAALEAIILEQMAQEGDR